jgi:signal transduction histidine kinase
VALELIFFSFDILEFSATLVVLGLLWFGDQRTAQVKSLIVVGVATCFWIIFDSIAMVARPEAYGYFYTLRSVMLVIDPYCLLWFFLSLNRSRLLKSRIVNRLMVLLPAVDVVLLFTDPLHHLVFEKHGFPLPEYGPLFMFHSVAAYAAVALTIVCIFRFVFVQKPPFWVSALSIIFSLMPVVVNVLFTLHVLPMIQDIAPSAFFVLFLVFALYAYRSRLINFKTMALTEIFEVFQDPIIFAEKDHGISSGNLALTNCFPDFELIPGKTSLGDFARYIKPRLIAPNPKDLFDDFGGDASGALGEFSIIINGVERTFTVNILRVFKRFRISRRLYGYAITLSDVSAYHSMILEINEKNKTLTELKELAESASRAKSIFLANMSHEIRTPLNAVIGLGELELRKDHPAGTRENLNKMYNSARILLAIINDLLDISKIESGRFELVPSNYSVSELVSDVVNINILRIGSKPIAFTLDIDGTIPSMLYGDELRVRQLLNNLLSNAFKYTLEGSVNVSVSYEPEAEQTLMLVCAIKDTGMGIKKESLSRLFEDYYQVDAGSSRYIEGTGLGLAIAKRFAEMMDGSISVESEFGKGSVFTVRIRQGIVDDAPLGEETARNLQELRFINGAGGRNEAGPSFTLPGRRFLVVDDVDINLEVARGMIEAYEAAVDCVLSGREAVELIRAGPLEKSEVPLYDAVFMDHMMPGMDGIEAVRIIRNEIDSEYARNIPIIALTANAIIGNEDMFLERGFNAMLAKPIEINKLEELLSKYGRRS